MKNRLDETFWSAPPSLPDGLELVRTERILSRRPGPGGEDVRDMVDMRWGGGRARLLMGYKASLLARDVPSLRRRLDEDGERWRRLSTHASHQVLLPAIVTAGASPSVVEACIAEGLAVFDLRGTVAIRGPGVFVHVEGKGKLPHLSKARSRMFTGASARVVRTLLSAPEQPKTAQSMAAEIGAGYATAFNALSRLEQEGFVVRQSPRTGFILRDPLRLLRAWIESGEGTARAVESFYAPAVDEATLGRAYDAIAKEGIKGIWSLASALLPVEAHVSGLPHGIYLSGSIAPLEDALGLRRVTPHNFVVLRAEAAAETDKGGIYSDPRVLPHGLGVAPAQLMVDCAAVGGRGAEQARFLLQRYSDSLRGIVS